MDEGLACAADHAFSDGLEGISIVAEVTCDVFDSKLRVHLRCCVSEPS